MPVQLIAASEVEFSILGCLSECDGQLPNPRLYVFDPKRFYLLFIH
jgi:hypothetical protein